MLKIIVLLFAAAVLAVQCEDELVAAIVIFRHGDRPPRGTYKNDIYDASVWPADYGQLTNTGKQQHYALGQWFPQRYDGFLSEQYNKSEIYIQSTDVDLTLMSVESNLAGLYPPKGDQIWNEQINWQPVPIHTIPQSSDEVLAQQKTCAKYKELSSTVNDLDYFKQIYEQYEDVFSYVSNYSGEDVQTLDQLSDIWNILYVEELYNLTLPEWTAQVYPQPMYNLSVIGKTQPTYTTEMARLKSGRLLYEIVNYFTEYATGTSDLRKFIMYSAHDSTIINLMNSMGVFDNEWPAYASSLIFELRRGEGDAYLNVLYKRSEDELVNITLDSCDFDCTLSDVLSILEPVMITANDWEHECNQ